MQQYLLSQGYYSDWLLRWEASTGNENVVKELLANNNTRVNEYGLPSKRTALHQAALKGYSVICTVLIDKGAALNEVDDKNESPLYLAISNKHFTLAKDLVSKGADISIKNKRGDNVLSLLTKMNENDLKQELIALHRQFTDKTVKQSDLATNASSNIVSGW